MKKDVIIILAGLLISLFVTIFTHGFAIIALPAFGYFVRFLENMNKRRFNAREALLFILPAFIIYLLFLLT